MAKIYSKVLLGLFLLLLGFAGNAQVSVTATSGTTGPTAYTTLKAAFDAINAGTHKGTVTVSISGNTSETASAVLNASAGTASYTAVNINATATATVTLNAAAPLINLNGATNVTIDGASKLVLVNPNAGGTVITFNNDATGNTLKNTTLKGGTNQVTSGFPTAGVITFNGSATGNGNDNNTIDNCDVDGTNTAACCLYSTSLNTTAAGENSGVTVKNSKFHDNINNTAAAPVTFFLDGGSTGWTIQGNSFYFTSALSSNQQVVIRPVLIIPDFTTDAHTVTGNFIGGNAPGAAGTMTLGTSGVNVIGFIGLDVETAGTNNVVQNNIIRNINLSYAGAAGSFANSGIFSFIGGFNGATTISGNTVSNLTFSNTQGFISLQAIHVNARVSAAGSVTPTFTISGNTVNNITGNAGGGTAGDVQITGIRLETSSGASLTNTATANPSFVVSGNTVSNINAPFAGTSTLIRGIGTVTTQSATGPSTALLFPKVDINNNIIHSFTTSSVLSNYGAAVCVGVHFGGSGGGNNVTDVQKITHNTIFNLSATNSSLDSGTVVAGISATTGVHDISRNRIYDLKNSAPGTTRFPGVVGITERAAVGASQITNNFISLGNGLTNNLQVFGILQNLPATGPVNVYHNSVVISGAGAAGNTQKTAAFVRGTEFLGTGVTTPVVIKNNIFYNTRTGGGQHFAIANVTTTGLTSDFNDLYSSTASTIALWGTTPNDLATFKTNSGDANSKSVTVSFQDVPTANLHLTGTSIADANLNGTPVGVTVDYDAEARSATAPKIGADEPAACTAPAITTQPTAVVSCAGTVSAFTVTATGSNLTYQWRKGGTNITGAIGSSYTIPQTVAGDAANYDVVITNACGTVTSTAVALTVNACTAVSNVDADVVGSILMPNVVHNTAVLRVTSRKAMNINWNVIDAQGRVVMKFSQQVVAGQNDLQLNLSRLSGGAYYISGATTKGNTGVITMFKK